MKVGKVVGILDEVLKNFDEDNEVKKRSGSHKIASYEVTIVKLLVTENLLGYSRGRKHNTFGTTVRNPIKYINHEALLSYMYIQLNHIIHGF